MIKWEYATVYMPSHLETSARANLLNDMGRECWELIGHMDRVLMFKRPDESLRASFEEMVEYVGKPCDCLSVEDVTELVEADAEGCIC